MIIASKPESSPEMEAIMRKGAARIGGSAGRFRPDQANRSRFRDPPIARGAIGIKRVGEIAKRVVQAADAT